MNALNSVHASIDALVASGKLVGRQRLIMEAISVQSGTSAEIVRTMAMRGEIDAVGCMGDWRSRFNELQGRGLIVESGSRKCAVTGRTCIVWAATGRAAPLSRHKGHGTSPLAKWKAVAAALAEDLREVAPRKRSLAEFERLRGDR